jgi:hypothetical protein
MVISDIPLRIVCGAAQTHSHPVLLVDHDGVLILDAAAILLVIVPILLGWSSAPFEVDSDPFPVVPPPSY